MSRLSLRGYSNINFHGREIYCPKKEHGSSSMTLKLFITNTNPEVVEVSLNILL